MLDPSSIGKNQQYVIFARSVLSCPVDYVKGGGGLGCCAEPNRPDIYLFLGFLSVNMDSYWTVYDNLSDFSDLVQYCLN